MNYTRFDKKLNHYPEPCREHSCVLKQPEWQQLPITKETDDGNQILYFVFLISNRDYTLMFEATFSLLIFYFRLMKPTQHYLDKLTAIVHEADYKLRYERGTFQSGWCLLESRRVIVLNKFLDTEGRINTLMELIPQLPVDFDKLTLDSQKLYEDLVKTTKQKAE